MNFMLVNLNNIELSPERFDILVRDDLPGINIYMKNVQGKFTYFGRNMTNTVKFSPVKKDLGKYDANVLFRKPMIVIFETSELEERRHRYKKALDEHYLPKEMRYTDLVQALILALWLVKDCSVYMGFYYFYNTDNRYSSKGTRLIQQTDSRGKTCVTIYSKSELEEAYDYLSLILDTFSEEMGNQRNEDATVSYNQGTLNCDIEAAINGGGNSFYRMLILIQLARKTGFLPEKISMYCATLECLFAIEKNHKSNISGMTASFIAVNNDEEIEIIRDMRVAYEIRSDFVHGDVNKLMSKESELVVISERIDDYVRRATKKAFSDVNYKYYDTKADRKRVREYFNVVADD